MAKNPECNTKKPEHGSFALIKQGNDNEMNTYEESKNDDLVDVEARDSKNYNVNKLCFSRGVTIKKLQKECNSLKDQLKKAGVDLESYRRTFETVTGELKKQLDVAKKRESESITKTVGLRLENEKLQVLLESRQNLVDNLKKELLNVKRVLKFAIKDICNVSGAESFLDLEESPRARSPKSARSPRSPRVRFAEDGMDKTRHETR